MELYNPKTCDCDRGRKCMSRGSRRERGRRTCGHVHNEKRVEFLLYHLDNVCGRGRGRARESTCALINRLNPEHSSRALHVPSLHEASLLATLRTYQ